MKSKLMVSVSGIRGILGDSFDPAVVTKYLNGFARFIGRGTVVIGRDNRKSGLMVQKLVESILQFNGIDVIDLGIVPTPLVLQYVRKHNLQGGVVITASHNPIEWSALKLVKEGGVFLNQTDFGKFMRIIDKNEDKSTGLVYKDVHKLGGFKKDEKAVKSYINDFVMKFNINRLKNRKFRVAYDPGNGAGVAVDYSFLNRLGCISFAINDEITGDFNRVAEPTPSVLKKLAETVIANKCDIGFAQDPDADRLVVVDEMGKPLSEELTLALSVDSVLFKNRDKTFNAVINMSTSRLVEDIIGERGTVYRSAVGEANVYKMMLDNNAIIGGEGNGGVIYPHINSCRDSFVGMALILSLLIHRRQPLSKVINEYPQYFMVKKKIKLANDDKNLEKKMLKQFSHNDGYKNIDKTDGIRINFSDSWVHIRKSNTEPVMRVIAEAKTKKAANLLVADVQAIIG